MNYGKVEEPSSSPSRSPSMARRAATFAILTVTLSRLDRAPLSSTVDAPGGGPGRKFFEEVSRDNLNCERADRVQLIFERRLAAATTGNCRTRVVQQGD